MKSQCIEYYFIFLSYTIIIIVIYNLLKKTEQERVENFSILNRNPMELVGKYCDINVIKMMRDYCDPQIFQYFRTNSMISPLYSNYITNNMAFTRIGSLYKKIKDENDKYNMLPLYVKGCKGNLYEYMTMFKNNGNTFEIPVFKHSHLNQMKSNSIKSREIYDDDIVHIDEPINGDYIAKIY